MQGNLSPPDSGVVRGVRSYKDAKEFVASLAKPRKLMFLVTAGPTVDKVIDTFAPLLEAGDILIDGGNEWFENSERRAAHVTEVNNGVLYVAMGVSGGESGARFGPSIMPGGPPEAWEALKPILTAIAAQVDGEACTCHIGPGSGCGNYVKMVHNGIEYGDMQLIAEATHLCRELGGLDAPAVAALLSKLNGGSLDSFLMETTAAVYLKKDPQPACAGKALVRSTRPAASRCSKPCTACLVSAHTPRCSLCPLRRAPVDGSPQVDAVFDSCGSKGTGKWTIQQAAELGVPASTHAAALEARYLSSLKAQRVTAADMFPDAGAATEGGLQDGWQRDLEDALLASKLCSYAQGMAHLRAASEKYDWNLQLHELAEIWQGGCIIRAKVLHLVQAAFAKDPRLPNLLLDEAVAAEMRARLPGWRRFVLLAMRHGVPVPALSASLTYFDTFRTSLLRSAQCIQAQRDCFGGHGFQRLDMPGTHTVTWR